MAHSPLKSVLIGTSVTVRGTFRDVNDALADPISVTIVVKKPDDSETTYTTGQLTHVSTGIWQVIVGTDQAGQWIVNVAGAGNGVDVDNEGTFSVRPRRT